MESAYCDTGSSPSEAANMGEFAGLSYVFMARDHIFVDTAAQHGLVGSKTLHRHDALLQQVCGLQVQCSGEDGGKVAWKKIPA